MSPERAPRTTPTFRVGSISKAVANDSAVCGLFCQPAPTGFLPWHKTSCQPRSNSGWTAASLVAAATNTQFISLLQLKRDKSRSEAGTRRKHSPLYLAKGLGRDVAGGVRNDFFRT